MKEVWNFVVWQWRQFEFWQKCFIFSSAFIGAAIVAEPPWAQYFGMVPLVVVGLFMLKWAIIDGTRSAWQRYKKERNSLLDTIKNS